MARNWYLALLVALLALGAVAPAASADPCGDTLASATTLGTDVRQGCTNDAATGGGDPKPISDAGGGHGVFFKWTAKSTGIAVVDLEGTTFDGVIGVYPVNGNSLNESAARTFDASFPRQAEHVDFDATNGTTYAIFVDGYEAKDVGTVNARVTQSQPLNDFFQGAQEVPVIDEGGGSYVGVAGMNNALAAVDLETGEPNHGISGSAHAEQSLWFRVTAPRSGRMTAATCWNSEDNATEFAGDTVLAVYSGAALGSLTTRATNDDSPAGCGRTGLTTRASFVGFDVTAGETLYMAVSLYVNNADESPRDGIEQLRIAYEETIPSVPQITSGPPEVSTDTGATFEFSSPDPDVASFQCSLDGAEFERCAEARRQSYTGLSQGAHTFRVRAVDAARNVGPAAERSWRIECPASGCTSDPRPGDNDDKIDEPTDGPLCGLLGNDTIVGTSKNDTIFGDACNDKLRLSLKPGDPVDGNDKLYGRAGDDKLYGAGGNDKLYGEAGKDQMDGGTGNDAASGGAGNDVALGGAGNDSLTGGAGNDRLDGGAGTDKLTGGAGTNRYKGGAGNDVLNARNGRVETVDCGSGRRDRAVVDRRDRVRGCERVSRSRR